MIPRLLRVGLLVALGWGCAGDDTPPRDPAGGPAAQRPAKTYGWQVVREADGIVAEQEKVPGSGLIALRGEGEVEAPLRAVAAVMMDLSRAPEWVDRVMDARVLDQPSDQEASTYWHVGAPGNVLDRDFLVRAVIQYAPPDRIRFNLQANTPPKAPTTRNIRGRLQQGSFELTAVDRGRTRVRCEVRVDPGEPLDEAIQGHLVRTWIHRTISQLRAAASHGGPSAEVAELLARQGFGDAKK